MDRGKLIERLMTTFLAELSDHVRTINDELLALEKDPAGPGREERYSALFRAAHSLKGASRSVGVAVIEEACHRLEEILAVARDEGAPLGPDLFALMFETADAVEEAGMRLHEQHDLNDSPLALLLPRLESAAKAYLEPPPPSPVIETVLPTEPPSTSQLPPYAPPAPDPTRIRNRTGAAGIDPRETPARPLTETATEFLTAVSSVTEGDRPAGASSYVRIPAEKLDSILARSGELLVARQRVEARSDDLAVLRDLVARWTDEWRAVAKPLQRILARNGEGPEVGPMPRRTVQAFLNAGERLAQIEKNLERLGAKMTGDRRHLARAAGELDSEVRRARMLPFADACQGLERTVRDVARQAGKEVELVIEGGRVELDRSVLEWLKDPLLHLVRNAVDHGIELPQRRRAFGKPALARITVRAALRGDQVEVVVADDGAGIDRDLLRHAARRRGLAEPNDARDLTDLIFLPGFSTSTIITNISGRGVGLDVVKSRLEALHGTIELTSEPRVGTRFTLVVPLTLTTLRALLVSAGGQVFAVASATVQKLVRVDPADVRSVEGQPVLTLGGPPVPVVSLTEALGLRNPAPVPKGPLHVVIVASGERRMAFVVDELLTEQELIVKNLGERIRRVRNVTGATILSSGRIALVLNAAGLIRSAQGRRTGPLLIANTAPAPVEMRKRLLVVDDSVTTRTLEKSILEAAGFEVTTAVDGEDGWRLLQEQGADLLISDIEMPRMDGFALTETVRSSPRFSRLPIVLITSRASERDKARGIEVGADAYIVKGAFDQNDLLETVAQLL